MDWLSCRIAVLEKRSSERSEISQASQALEILGEAKKWLEHEGKSFGSAPDLVQSCLTPPKQNSVHAWLSKAYCNVLKKRGVDGSEAMRSFNKHVWPITKKVPNARPRIPTSRSSCCPWYMRG